MEGSRGKSIASWIVQVVIGAHFILASLGKITSAPAVVQMFEDWGFPDGFHLLIGALELAGGIGLLIPKTAGYAALGLVGIMIGAAGTHLVNGVQVVRPLVFMVLLVVVVILRRPWPLPVVSDYSIEPDSGRI